MTIHTSIPGLLIQRSDYCFGRFSGPFVDGALARRDGLDASANPHTDSDAAFAQSYAISWEAGFNAPDIIRAFAILQSVNGADTEARIRSAISVICEWMICGNISGACAMARNYGAMIADVVIDARTGGKAICTAADLKRAASK